MFSARSMLAQLLGDGGRHNDCHSIEWKAVSLSSLTAWCLAQQKTRQRRGFDYYELVL